MANTGDLAPYLVGNAEGIGHEFKASADVTELGRLFATARESKIEASGSLQAGLVIMSCVPREGRTSPYQGDSHDKIIARARTPNAIFRRGGGPCGWPR
jgi:hypothetical protein